MDSGFWCCSRAVRLGFPPVNWTRSQILLFSSYIWLQLSKLMFPVPACPFHLELLRTETALPLRPCKLEPGPQRALRGSHPSARVQSLCAAAAWATQNACQQPSDSHRLAPLHLKRLQAPELRNGDGGLLRWLSLISLCPHRKAFYPTPGYSHPGLTREPSCIAAS